MSGTPAQPTAGAIGPGNYRSEIGRATTAQAEAALKRLDRNAVRAAGAQHGRCNGKLGHKFSNDCETLIKMLDEALARVK
jgi:hypothetical protein